MIVCHLGTNTLASSDVTLGGVTIASPAEGATLPAGFTEALLCSLSGFEPLNHGVASVSVDIASNSVHKPE